MAHSKNDKDYYNTPTRTTTHPIRRSIEALIKILNSATNKPYTCKELYCVLVKRAKENRIYVFLAEKWLCELGPIEEINEKKFSSATAVVPQRKRPEMRRIQDAKRGICPACFVCWAFPPGKKIQRPVRSRSGTIWIFWEMISIVDWLPELSKK